METETETATARYVLTKEGMKWSMCTGDARSFVYSIFKSSEVTTRKAFSSEERQIFSSAKSSARAMRCACFSNKHQECVCGTLLRVAAAVGLGKRRAGWRTLVDYLSLVLTMFKQKLAHNPRVGGTRRTESSPTPASYKSQVSAPRSDIAER